MPSRNRDTSAALAFHNATKYTLVRDDTGTEQFVWGSPPDPDAAGYAEQQEFGVSYRYHGIYAILARLTVHPKVPRPTAAKADPAVQVVARAGTWSHGQPP